jgi:hypothetical protein
MQASVRALIVRPARLIRAGLCVSRLDGNLNCLTFVSRYVNTNTNTRAEDQICEPGGQMRRHHNKLRR